MPTALPDALSGGEASEVRNGHPRRRRIAFPAAAYEEMWLAPEGEVDPAGGYQLAAQAFAGVWDDPVLDAYADVPDISHVSDAEVR